MDTLHEVVYQIVSNPTLLTEITQNAHVLLDKFNLSPLEANSLLALVQDGNTIHTLLSVENLTQASTANVWVP